MAVSFQHVAILSALVFACCLVARARILDENSEKFAKFVNDKEGTFISEKFTPNIELDKTFRYPRKMMRPRATRVGDNLELFTARGYGKRSGCSSTWCKNKMELFGARRYGKRDPKVDSVLCMLANCNDRLKAISIDNFSSMMERRDDERADQRAFDEE
ncbi:uncharacterized protein LOC132698527 isoform X2 [Cylas formicarius]|uniref:uncharacterized protein LOC132698527 isoform X2 n=1 Tax=Cylas formicarius TaxID=197179 RepID=UPI002958D192|nr:uncharacterized protein LOC132698527 isoform X2 [Cylas formicarius]